MSAITQKYVGKDNYGQAKRVYLDRIMGMSDAALETECEQKVWLSAYAHNNPRSDYHWQVDACYDECQQRGRPGIYKNGWDRAYRSAGHEPPARAEEEDGA